MASAVNPAPTKKLLTREKKAEIRPGPLEGGGVDADFVVASSAKDRLANLGRKTVRTALRLVDANMFSPEAASVKTGLVKYSV